MYFKFVIVLVVFFEKKNMHTDLQTTKIVLVVGTDM